MTVDEIEKVAKVFAPLGAVTYELTRSFGEDGLHRFWTITDPVTHEWLTSFSTPATPEGDDMARSVIAAPKKALSGAKRSMTAMRRQFAKVRAAFDPRLGTPEDIDPLGR